MVIKYSLYEKGPPAPKCNRCSYYESN